jgi:hypothetical protein
MRRLSRRRAWGAWGVCVSFGGGALVVCVGCGALIGLKDVPNPEEGGTDATSPTPDGGHPRGEAGTHPDSGTMTDGKLGTDAGPGADVVIPPPPPPGCDARAPDDASPGTSVLEYHNNPARTGLFVDSTMTTSYAGSLTLDTTFAGSAGPGVPINGPLWGQPLYVQNGIGGKGTFYVADDSNDLYAIDEATGSIVKSLTPLEMSAGQAGSGCGNVSPVGITSAPYIDLSSRTMYIADAVGTGSGIMTFKVHALSIDDFSENCGWPIDISTLTSSGGVAFNPPPQGQRGGLALVNGYLYVIWGGEDGDCGDYHGWVVSIPLSNPKGATGFTTAAQGGGMWNVGGVASDGTDIFAVSGNATGGSGSTWQDYESEAVFRFHDGTAFDNSNTANFFTPSNWQDLDNGDVDLTGASPLVLDVAGATPSALVVAMGKSGVMHLLDRSNLGGIGTGDGASGEGLYSAKIGSGQLRGAAAAFTTSSGTYIAVHTDGGGVSCPIGSGDLVTVQITATNPPTIKPVWCANSGGNGSPIVTTTDSSGSNPIVWIVGTEGTNQLTGWNGVTGANVFNGGGIAMDTVIHWTTLIEANGRIIVGATDKLYAFKGK